MRGNDLRRKDPTEPEIHGIIIVPLWKALALLFVVPLVLLALIVGFAEGSLFSTGVVLAAALGCVAVGTIIGFLFGLPRTTQRDSDEVRDNTNLEQVSDWLVKVLIGASLVQLGKVKSALITYSELLASSVASDCAPFALFLMVYFGVLGFLGAFLLTKLGMPYALKKALESVKDQKAIDLASEAQVMASVLPVMEGALTGISRRQSNTTAATDAEKNEARRAIEVGRDGLTRYPTNRPIAIVLGRLIKEFDGKKEAIAHLDQVVSSFEAAKMTAGNDATNYAALLYNRACYKNLLSDETEEPEKSKLKQSAVEDLQKSWVLDEQNKKEAEQDSDLASLLRELNRTKG